LATLISFVPKMGYGGIILKEMVKYAKEHAKTAIGFCNPKLSDYYKSLGADILTDGAQRFYSMETYGKLKQFISGNDVLYVEGSDDLMKEIISRPDLPVICDRYHW